MPETIILDKKYSHPRCVFKYFLKRNRMFFLAITRGPSVRNANSGESFTRKHCHIIGWVAFCRRVYVNHRTCIWECLSRPFVLTDVTNSWTLVRRNFTLGSLVARRGIASYNSHVADLPALVTSRGYNVFPKVFEISYDLFGDKRGDNLDEGES